MMMAAVQNASRQLIDDYYAGEECDNTHSSLHLYPHHLWTKLVTLQKHFLNVFSSIYCSQMMFNFLNVLCFGSFCIKYISNGGLFSVEDMEYNENLYYERFHTEMGLSFVYLMISSTMVDNAQKMIEKETKRKLLI
ncbi:uncharacterized protein LOC120354081 [Nilaparvata lugens]|uniref:uncharacterized protein LOC120354081 n=1 Tax=Nilaparvata lugens TaxID=108931 RepID=UPI00193EA81F|nr:uncharacterized protein LOC120354081 [Nilaparvata lugens]